MKVFKEILELDDDSDVHKACVHEGVETLDDLLGLTTQDINDLTFQMADKTKGQISKGQRGAIMALQSLSIKRGLDNDPIAGDWNNLTKAQYDEYRTGPEW